MTRFDYRTDWQTYAYPETNTVSCDDDITSTFGSIRLSGSRFSGGGIPLLVRGSQAYINSENENTIIFGETGCKKTRSIISPLIATTAGARESAFITDVKGELSSNPKLRNYMRKCGINAVYLNFRDFRGDGYNLLEQPLRMYARGERDKAAAMVMKLVNSLNRRYEGTKADPFWALSAQQYLMPIIQMILDVCSKDERMYEMANMLSVNSFIDAGAAEELLKALNAGMLDEHLPQNSRLMLKSVLSNPDRTLACIIGTVQSMIQDFTIQKDLMAMLSGSTFSVAEMYEKPTFVFLIVPDENSAYDSISGILIDMFYNELIERYSETYQNKKESPCRINFICDEFCNMSINDMRSKISASRSRNMRWFLVCQSKKQLDSVYAEESGTIIGNCKNIFFLKSADPDMLDYISDLCGKTGITDKDVTEPLISREMLKELKKERDYKEALYLRDDIKYFAKLPDIDSYSFLTCSEADAANGYSDRCAKEIKALTLQILVNGMNDAEEEMTYGNEFDYEDEDFGNFDFDDIESDPYDSNCFYSEEDDTDDDDE